MKSYSLTSPLSRSLGHSPTSFTKPNTITQRANELISTREDKKRGQTAGRRVIYCVYTCTGRYLLEVFRPAKASTRNFKSQKKYKVRTLERHSDPGRTSRIFSHRVFILTFSSLVSPCLCYLQLPPAASTGPTERRLSPRIIPTLHLQIIRIQRRTQPSIDNELWPIDTEPSLHRIPVRAGDCKIGGLLVQNKDVVVRVRWRLRRGCRSKVRTGARRPRRQDLRQIGRAHV